MPPKYTMDLDVNLNIVTGAETEKTIKRVEDLGKAMADLAKFSQSGGQSLTNVGKQVLQVGSAAFDVSAAMKEFSDSMGITAENQKEVAKQNKVYRTALQSMNLILSRVSQAEKEAQMAVTEFDKSLQTFKVAPTAQNLEAVTTQFTDFSTTGEGAAKALERISRTFSNAGPLLSLESFGGLTEKFGGDIGKTIDYVRNLDTLMGGMRGRTNFLQSIMGDPAKIEIWASSMQKGSDELYKLQMASQIAVGQIGALKMAYMDLGRTFFWTGLGTMFALMSIQRLGRSAIQTEANELSLTRALQAETDAQDKLNRYTAAGITTGKAYATAAINAKEATMSRKLSEDRLRDSIMNQNLTTLQLVFGTIPTAIRSTVDLYKEVLKVVIARTIDTGTLASNTASQITNTAVKGAATVAQEAMNASMMRGIIIAGGLTLGLTAGLAALGMLMAQASATESIEKANREFSKLRDTTTVRHSPALYEAFQLIGEGMDRSSKSMSSYASEVKVVTSSIYAMKQANDQLLASIPALDKAMLEAKFTNVQRYMATAIPPTKVIKSMLDNPISYTGKVPTTSVMDTPYSLPGQLEVAALARGINPDRLEIPNSGINKGASIGNIPTSTRNVSVNVTGPFYVSKESDMKTLSDRIVASIYRRGG